MSLFWFLLVVLLLMLVGFALGGHDGPGDGGGDFD